MSQSRVCPYCKEGYLLSHTCKYTDKGMEEIRATKVRKDKKVPKLSKSLLDLMEMNALAEKIVGGKAFRLKYYGDRVVEVKRILTESRLVMPIDLENHINVE